MGIREGMRSRENRAVSGREFLIPSGYFLVFLGLFRFIHPSLPYLAVVLFLFFHFVFFSTTFGLTNLIVFGLFSFHSSLCTYVSLGPFWGPDLFRLISYFLGFGFLAY